MTYSDAIIKRLTDLCVERGITTNKLATLSGITQSTLNSMMRGETKNPKLKTLRKIAMGFNSCIHLHAVTGTIPYDTHNVVYIRDFLYFFRILVNNDNVMSLFTKLFY